MEHLELVIMIIIYSIRFDNVQRVWCLINQTFFLPKINLLAHLSSFRWEYAHSIPPRLFSPEEELSKSAACVGN
jgi:hypothetical protein